MPQQHSIFIAIAAVIGVGVVGGGIGTWADLRRAKSSRERRYIWTMAAALTLFISAFAVAQYFLPPGYKHYAFGPYLLGLPLIVRYLNRRHEEIRREDSAEQISSN